MTYYNFFNRKIETEKDKNSFLNAEIKAFKKVKKYINYFHSRQILQHTRILENINGIDIRYYGTCISDLYHYFIEEKEKIKAPLFLSCHIKYDRFENLYQQRPKFSKKAYPSTEDKLLNFKNSMRSMYSAQKKKADEYINPRNAEVYYFDNDRFRVVLAINIKDKKEVSTFTFSHETIYYDIKERKFKGGLENLKLIKNKKLKLIKKNDKPNISFWEKRGYTLCQETN